MVLLLRRLSAKCLFRFSRQSLKTSAHTEENFYTHEPVMPKEVLEVLNPKSGEVFLDMTFGAGGHTKLILEAAPNVRVLALDRDPEAIAMAHDLAKNYPRNTLIPIQGQFSSLPEILKSFRALLPIDGVLMDLGCSSMQLDNPARGFSLSKLGPLDMRMDGTQAKDVPTAQDVVNNLGYDDLSKIFKIYGEEKAARKVAQAIVDSRFMMHTIRTTKDLAAVVYTALGDEDRKDKLNRPVHQATKVFQALRIFVNDELNELDFGMKIAHRILRKGTGRLAAISFHSLEDRIVKHHLGGMDRGDPLLSSLRQRLKNPEISFPAEQVEALIKPRWNLINKNVIVPTEEEVERNPRSRSAKLRAAFKEDD